MTRPDPALIALFLVLPMLLCLALHPIAWITVPR
jgi:hypothetical protein